MTRAMPGRREFLKAAAALLGSGLSPDCAARQSRPAPPGHAPAHPLAPLHVSADRIIRTVVGLRPFRPSGFVLRSEPFGSKTLIHNYGHGGGGVTLSWGTAHLAVEEAVATGHTRAAVIGCGAVGLATARLLQRRGFDVTIYTKDLPPATTSNIAGATWFPSSVADTGRRTPAFDAQFLRAARLSYRYFQDLVGDMYGVRWLDQFNVSDKPITGSWEQALMADFLPPEKPLGPTEHPFAKPCVNRWTTMLIEPPVYLDALTRDFQLAGGRLVVRNFASAGALADLDQPLIVNCTGLGARALFGDP